MRAEGRLLQAVVAGVEPAAAGGPGRAEWVVL